MKRLLDWVQGVAAGLGGPGLFLIAFLDSSFLSFPEVVDLLIIWLMIQHPHRCCSTRCCRRSGRWPAASCCSCSPARAARRSCASASTSATSTAAMAVVQKYGLLERRSCRRSCRRPRRSRSSSSPPASRRSARSTSSSRSRSGAASATSARALLALVRRAGDRLPARERARDGALDGRGCRSCSAAGLDPLAAARGGRSRLAHRPATD